ncbi:hypothetical protein [Paraburkholderia sp.]|uniref:hypothetical protein n=1 Tax=Paraburkholderia sp. TaxID=1926495 RepID=UPI0025EA7D92|nr:hypothetical protein [Paraburkholderia sp.]
MNFRSITDQYIQILLDIANAKARRWAISLAVSVSRYSPYGVAMKAEDINAFET